MASVLKRLTGVDPFTVFAVTMGERSSRDEEHPVYRFAAAHGLVPRPTIFVDSVTGRTYGNESFDAYMFWPRSALIDGRPDWLVKTLGRRPVRIPPALRQGLGLRLVQARREGDPADAIPVDQVLLGADGTAPGLMLPEGTFELRTINPAGVVLAEARIRSSAP
jgi:hypothetical protein